MTITNLLLILLALAVGWILLKFILRLTMRIFACGCFALLALAGIAWGVSQLL